MKTHSSSIESKVSWVGLVNLFTVYLIWGSTYLAIRVAVKGDTGFPPFILVSSRVILAGGLLLLLGIIQRQRIRLTRDELVTLVISGLLLWVGGNGLVSWSEKNVDSGLAALIVGATPIWVAVMEAIIDRKAPTMLLVGSLLIGFGGIAVLTVPVMRSGLDADIWPVIGLLVAALSWGAGSIFQGRRPLQLSPFVSSGYQHLFGCIGLLAISLAIGEKIPSPSTDAWLAWGYLVIFGSIIAFTSYINALHILPTNIVMTYAYVNPVIAVFLGWLVLGEAITSWTVLGTALVLLGVTGVFETRYKKKGNIVRELDGVGNNPGSNDHKNK